MQAISLIAILLAGFAVAALIAALPMLLLWRWQKRRRP